jgi:hypothetical protein
MISIPEVFEVVEGADDSGDVAVTVAVRLFR